MRTFFILVCSVALACPAGAAQNDKKSKKQAQKNRQAQSTQYARPTVGAKKAAPKHYQAASTGTSYQKAKARQQANSQAYQASAKTKTAKGQQRIAGQQATSRTTYYQKPKTRQQVNNQTYQSSAKLKTPKGQQRVATQNGQAGRYATSTTYSKKTKQWKGNTASAAAFQSNKKKYKAHHFNLASNTRSTKYAAVKYQQNRRIWGSENWHGNNYWAFRNYRPVWHDRVYWRSHYNRVVFVYGGWYYWNAGWWYPAWGYDPGAYYVWDGPIYAYNGLPPDQVVANVQAALQEQGYYQGEVDGLLGPLTREAIAGYQRDHGLYMTSAIDEPTLESLGMV
jgi:Putative peptidoglycan binding domain